MISLRDLLQVLPVLNKEDDDVNVINVTVWKDHHVSDCFNLHRRGDSWRPIESEHAERNDYYFNMLVLNVGFYDDSHKGINQSFYKVWDIDVMPVKIPSKISLPREDEEK